MIYLVLLSILAIVFWVWMLVDCMQREPPESMEKLTWALVILLGSVIGAAIYYFVRKVPRERV